MGAGSVLDTTCSTSLTATVPLVDAIDRTAHSAAAQASSTVLVPSTWRR